MSTVHDCFVVNKIHGESIKELYFENFIKVIFNFNNPDSKNIEIEKHPIYHFYNKNFQDHVVGTEKLMSLITKYRENQLTIYENIKSKHLSKNPYILKE